MKLKGLLDRVKVFVSLFVFTCSIFPIQALSRDQGLDYNKHYQFPISLGVGYQTLSPFATYGSNFNIYEISAIARYPIPTSPVLQPTLKLGR